MESGCENERKKIELLPHRQFAMRNQIRQTDTDSDDSSFSRSKRAIFVGPRVSSFHYHSFTFPLYRHSNLFPLESDSHHADEPKQTTELDSDFATDMQTKQTNKKYSGSLPNLEGIRFELAKKEGSKPPFLSIRDRKLPEITSSELTPMTFDSDLGNLQKRKVGSDEYLNTAVLENKHPRTFYCREWVFGKILKYLSQSKYSTTLATNFDELETITESCTAAAVSMAKHDPHSSGRRIARIVIVGGPGSGKTTICKRIVESHKQATNLLRAGLPLQPMPLSVQVSAHVLFYYFCSAQLKETLSLTNFVLSIRNQILKCNHPVAELFTQALQASDCDLSVYLTPEQITTSPDKAFCHGILALLNNITSHLYAEANKSASNHQLKQTDGSSSGVSFSPGEICPPVQHLLFIVDGVDECLSEFFDWCEPRAVERLEDLAYRSNRTTPPRSLLHKKSSTNILELLTNALPFFPEWLTLLVTCRRQNRNLVGHLFSGSKRITIDDLHKAAVSNDVQQYLFARMAAERDLQLAFRAYMHSDLFSLLRIKSSACILYLETILDAIAERWLVPEQLALIPGTLNGLFMWLAQNLFSKSKGPSTFDLVRSLLNVVLASPRPISERGLYFILRNSDWTLTFDEFHARLGLLQRILVTQPPDKSSDRFDSATARATIRFFHSSFAEWLLDVKHCTAAYLCDICQGHRIITQALNSEDFPEDLRRYLLGDLKRESLLDPKLTSKSGESSSLEFPHRDQDHVQYDQLRAEKADPYRVRISACESSVYSSTEQSGAAADTRTNYTSECFPTDGVSQITADDRRKHEDSHSLVIAARKGHFDRVKELLASHVDVNQLDEDGWSALRTAAWRGHSDIVDLLLAYGAGVNLAGPDGRSALRAAAWAGHEEIVQRLLDAGADPNQQDAEGRSPLIAAAYMGHVGVVEILAQAGADLNHADEDGRTALHVAAFCVRPSEVHQEVVSCLLESGANPNIMDSEGITPLLGAARIGNHVVCELCLESDTDMNQTDKLGNTALMLAVIGGHTSVVRLLLFWGAAVDGMDSAGRSLLSLAAAIGNGPIVQELIARGLDEAHRDHAGCTPLHLAAAGPNSPVCANYNPDATADQYSEVVRILLDSGAHLDDTDAAGRTSLLIACENNQLEIANVLLSYLPPTPTLDGTSNQSESATNPMAPTEPLNSASGGSFGFASSFGPSHSGPLNQPSLDGQTPLRAAALCNNPDLVRLLLSVGADPDYQDSYGRTTLYLLALEGMVDMANLLLHTPAPGAHARPGSSTLVGANPVLSDDEGRCPLHVATWQGHLDMVKLLLQAGTPVDIRDREGRTPLQLAAWQGHANICHLLLAEGNARVDAVCSQGATSLCIAAQEGHFDVCSVLLQAGANPYQADSHGRTPYRVALKAEHLDICKLLEQGYGQKLSRQVPECAPVAVLQTSADLTYDSSVSHENQSLVGQRENEQGWIAKGQSFVASSDRPHPIPAEGMVPGLPITTHTATPALTTVTGDKVYLDDVNPYARPPGPLFTRAQYPPQMDQDLVNAQQMGVSVMYPQRPPPPGYFIDPRTRPMIPAQLDPRAGRIVPWMTAGQWQSARGLLYHPAGGFQPPDAQGLSFLPIITYPAPTAAGHGPVLAHYQVSNLFPNQPPPNAILSPHHFQSSQPGVVPVHKNNNNNSRMESRHQPVKHSAENFSRFGNPSKHQGLERENKVHCVGANTQLGKAPIRDRMRAQGLGTPDVYNKLTAQGGDGQSGAIQTPLYPDLLPHQFHQMHLNARTCDLVPPLTSNPPPISTSSITHPESKPPVKLGVGSATHETGSNLPAPVKVDSVVDKKWEKSGQFSEQNDAVRRPDRNSVEATGEADLRPPAAQMSNTETKLPLTKSAIAGMFGLGHRKGKKSRKQNSATDTSELTASTKPASPQTATGEKNPRAPNTTNNPAGKPNSSSKLRSFPVSSLIHGHKRSQHQNTPTSLAQSGSPAPQPPPTSTATESESSHVSNTAQLEAIARRLACCSQPVPIVSQPSDCNVTYVMQGAAAGGGGGAGRGFSVPPYSPQIWKDSRGAQNDPVHPM
ncbi:unnamed protein product [Calicophoron daubneyi]|uniref:Ankyrin repeat domain-containing protein 50 n=1 Tax=Calicophoron daubneyi TaxID=300641 RepID=A0AAV2U025_CALDB